VCDPLASRRREHLCPCLPAFQPAESAQCDSSGIFLIWCVDSHCPYDTEPWSKLKDFEIFKWTEKPAGHVAKIFENIRLTRGQGRLIPGVSMSLKYKYLKKDEVPGEHAALYIEKDGVFVLDVEGASDKAKLEEFRANNIKLQNDLKKFEGIDAEKAKELLKRQVELDEQNLIKSGDVTKIVESKIAPFRIELDKERDEKKQLRSQLDTFTLAQTLQTLGTKAGVRPSALPDLQARARGAFNVIDGQIVPVDASMTLDGWLDALKADAPHLFAENSGGGASGNGSGGAGFNSGTRNPWKKETWNFTEQGRITRDNPRIAAQLATAAGR